ncbi:MAG TPA: M20/M25/M40 family metallo-hydrolase [Thermoflexales bacterium]|nr:M20/M25/M40 family metallo-hydrolase [Thermoflexales bacterium]
MDDRPYTSSIVHRPSSIVIMLPSLHLTKLLVNQPSITDSADETSYAEFLGGVMASQPAFAGLADGIRAMRTLRDDHERYNLFGLARKSGRKTIALCGHYDVVSVENYGALQALAFDTEKLLPALISQLEKEPQTAEVALALKDLKSGDYLPGRGALDMKSGLAIGLDVANRFAASSGAGNLLFVATPDEENASHGMRSAVEHLAQLGAEWNLDIVAAINLDASVNRGEDTTGRAVFLGTVSKLLVSALFIGKPTHAGAPFDGLSANLLAAEFVRACEVNPLLADMGGGEPAPAPITLKMTDLKEHYDVTTPAMSWVALNMLSHTRTPAQVMALATRTAHHAMAQALAGARSRARRYATARDGGRRAGGLHQNEQFDWQPRVMTFAELVEYTRRARGEAALQAWHDEVATLRGDFPSRCKTATEKLARLSGVEGPCAVVGIASLYYPATHLGDGDAAFREAIDREVTRMSAETGDPIYTRGYFEGVSDMSFIGCEDSPENAKIVMDNTPIWNSGLFFDYELAAKRRIPIVNIGPWGRDYHQRAERAHIPYSFGVVPELVFRIVQRVLGE